MEPRLKRTTMQNKRYLIEHRVLPFFGDLPLNEITPAHVRKWQSQLLADKVAPTYAKTINNQLSGHIQLRLQILRPGYQSGPPRR